MLADFTGHKFVMFEMEVDRAWREKRERQKQKEEEILK